MSRETTNRDHLTQEIEAHELASYLCDVDEEADDELIAAALEDTYGITMEAFTELIDDLLPLIDFGRGGLGGKLYQGFARKMDPTGDGERVNQWLARVERAGD